MFSKLQINRSTGNYSQQIKQIQSICVNADIGKVIKDLVE